MCCCWWSSPLFLAWVWMSLIEKHCSSLNSSVCPEPSSTGFNEEISADRFCFYCTFNCWQENSGKDSDVSWIPNIIGYWSIIKQTAGLNGMDLTQRLPIFQNITCDHSLSRLDDTFPAKHTPENGTVILRFVLFSEKKPEGKLSKLSTFLKRQWAFCIPDLSLAEGMLISCWAPALIIPAKAETYTSWLTLVSTGCWSTPERLCALLPPAPSQATWYFSEPYIALEELYRGAQNRMTQRAAVQGSWEMSSTFALKQIKWSVPKWGMINSLTFWRQKLAERLE